MVYKVNGTQVATQPVTLGGGKSTKVSFSVTEDIAGTYQAEIDGQRGQFTVKGKPPTAHIDSISSSQANQGETISFNGHGTDLDGSVVGYSWRSSIGGLLSTSNSFNTSSLVVGTHTIYFKVKDNDGLWSEEVSGTVIVNPCSLDSSRYGFESSDIFWVAQTWEDSQAVTAVDRSDKEAKFGCYSMKLTVDLIGGDEKKGKGEAYVDMRYFPPMGVKAPVNLENVPITIWVYVPAGAAGESDRPNGVQVFVKDQNWKNEYGTWFNLPNYTDRWVPISLTPSRQKPLMGYIDEGFDPSKIVVVGVKIGAGKDSKAIFKGPIYVDGVNW